MVEEFAVGPIGERPVEQGGTTILRRRALHAALLISLVIAGVGARATTPGADFTPNGTEYHPLTFPVREPVTLTTISAARAIIPATISWARSSTTTGRGSLLLTRDGGLFTVGDARYEGSVPGLGWCPGPAAVALARTTTAAGYWILLSDGQIVAFGDAKAWGAPPISTRAPLRSRRSAERTH